MTTMALTLPSTCLVAVLLFGCPLLVAAADRRAFDDAVAVWHFRSADDVAGANSPLNVQGPVALGQPCEEDAKAASVTRGSDGFLADCAGGFFWRGKAPTAN